MFKIDERYIEAAKEYGADVVFNEDYGEWRLNYTAANGTDYYYPIFQPDEPLNDIECALENFDPEEHAIEDYSPNKGHDLIELVSDYREIRATLGCINEKWKDIAEKIENEQKQTGNAMKCTITKSYTNHITLSKEGVKIIKDSLEAAFAFAKTMNIEDVENDVYDALELLRAAEIEKASKIELVVQIES